MKYLILLGYILLFHWIGTEIDPTITIAFFGGIVRAAGASKDAKSLQKQADAINPIRPNYQTPQEVLDAVQSSKNMAEGDMAGYGRAIGQAQGSTANFLSQARNYATGGSGILQNLAIAAQGERSQINNINNQNAQFKQNAAGQMQNNLFKQATYSDQEFEYNENNPYQQQEADKRAFQQQAIAQRQASRDAWGSMIDGVTNTALTIGTAGTSSIFGKMFGGKKTG